MKSVPDDYKFFGPVEAVGFVKVASGSPNPREDFVVNLNLVSYMKRPYVHMVDGSALKLDNDAYGYLYDYILEFARRLGDFVEW